MEDKNVYIPKELRVGYRSREGTFTGLLAYVTYVDYKGELRKKSSWNSWKDNRIESSSFKNEPTEGFVINKDVGGASLGRARNTYIRVYDPRGFEVEIKVWNLLYILKNTSLKDEEGIVLEGNFVYGWDGTEMIIIPVKAPDYKKYEEYSKLLNEDKPVNVRDLVKGASYLTKQKDEYIYVGRYTMWGNKFSNNRRKVDTIDKGKFHVFVELDNYNEHFLKIVKLKSLGRRFIKMKTETPSINIGQVMDALKNNIEYIPIDPKKDEYKEITAEKIEKAIEKNYGDSLKVKTRDGELKLLKRNSDKEGMYYLRDDEERFYTGNKRVEMSLEGVEFRHGIKVLHRYLIDGRLYKIG